MNNPISTFIADKFFWGLIAILALNLFQRKHGEKAKKKRQATLYLAIVFFGLFCSGILIVQLKLHDLYLLIYLAIAAAIVYIFRVHLLPFRLKCTSCSTRLDPKDIVFQDSNMCEKCREKMDSHRETKDTEESV